MSARGVDGVVLDLDDTLLDTTALLLPAADLRVAATLVARGAAAAKDDVVRELEALRAAGEADALVAAVERLGGTGADREAAAAAFFAYEPRRLELDPVVDEALTELAGLAPLALLTFGDPATQRAKIEGLGLGPRFALCRVVGRGAAGGKTAALRELLAERKWRPARTVVCGDNPRSEIRAAIECGCVAVRVRREGAEFGAVAARVPSERAAHEVHHVAGLVPIVRRMAYGSPG